MKCQFIALYKTFSAECRPLDHYTDTAALTSVTAPEEANTSALSNAIEICIIVWCYSTEFKLCTVITCFSNISEVYNFESKPDPNVLDDDPHEREPETLNLPVIDRPTRA